MKKVVETVLKDIKPTKQEERALMLRISAVLSTIKKRVPEAKVILGGSGEKGTWLREAHDADIFVMFPASWSEKPLSDVLEKKLKNTFTLERLHGSRDYFQTQIEGFTFEIVPIIEIKNADDAKNITDVSPLHAKWVKKHKKFVDDIRLLKQFFKGANAYGAESYLNGFSGYICEVLTIYYGGFQKTVKALATWKEKTIIDVEHAYKGKKILLEMDKAKTQGPLIVVDPVQASRNAAAAVSLEKFLAVQRHAKAFLAHPDKRYFEVHPFTKEAYLKKKGNYDAFVLEAEALEGKKDVVGCKLVKAHHHILSLFERYGFIVKETSWHWNAHAYFAYRLDKKVFPSEHIIKGPPLRRKTFVHDFKKKHKDTFEKAGHLYAKEQRRYRSAKELVSDAVKDPYVLERVRSISL